MKCHIKPTRINIRSIRDHAASIPQFRVTLALLWSSQPDLLDSVTFFLYWMWHILYLFCTHCEENHFISMSSMAITSLLTSQMLSRCIFWDSFTGKVQLGKRFSVSLESTFVIKVNTVQILKAYFFFFFFFFLLTGVATVTKGVGLRKQSIPAYGGY